jgi:hypothetical protein
MENYKGDKMIIEGLKKYLAEETGCTIQHDGWPCGSCFNSIDIKLAKNISEYWQPVLSIRGDYNDFNWEEEYPNEDISKFPELVNELYWILRSSSITNKLKIIGEIK